MRLLIVTQAIDKNDLSLGFFHAWAAGFAAQVSALEIICLKKGVYNLPPHVRVHSLGKERLTGPAFIKRLRYGWRFLRLIVALRHNYDTVLVHMNDEYVNLGWPLWRLMGKRVGLWRNHVQGTWKSAISCRLADVIFYTSPNTYATRFAHAHRMPTGIEVDAYGENSGVQGSILSLGRIDPVKKIAELYAGFEALVGQGVAFVADVYGTPTPGREGYEESLAPAAGRLAAAGVLVKRPGVAHAAVPGLFSSHRVFVNLTPPGSFDKTIFEAMAAGCLVVATNPGVREVIGDDLFVSSLEPSEVARALKAAIEMPESARTTQATKQREYVQKNHSLTALIAGVLRQLTTLA